MYFCSERQTLTNVFVSLCIHVLLYESLCLLHLCLSVYLSICIIFTLFTSATYCLLQLTIDTGTYVAKQVKHFLSLEAAFNKRKKKKKKIPFFPSSHILSYLHLLPHTHITSLSLFIFLSLSPSPSLYCCLSFSLSFFLSLATST